MNTAPNPSADVSFSVIIPAYNAAGTIATAIDSCLAQSLAPLEILVVDDGSTDDTVARVKEISSPLVRLVGLEVNKGPGAARNAGMDFAKGSHFAFLDADDVWHVDKLKQMAAGIQHHPESVLWFHDFSINSSKARVASPANWFYFPYWQLLLRNVIAPSCAVITATHLRFYEPMRYCEDYDFWLRLAQQGDIYHLKEALTLRSRALLSKGGQSSRRWRMRRGEISAYTRLARQRRWLLVLLPFLWLNSLVKHLIKIVFSHDR